MGKYLYITAAWAMLIMLGNSCKKEDPRVFIVGKVREASKLATAEFTIDKIVHGTKSKKLAWFINLNEAKFLAYSRAVVKTGIDLKKLSKEDVKIDENSIRIKLPAVEVINFSYPPKYFKLDEFVTDDAFLNKISLYDQEGFFREAEMDIRNNLKYMGVIESTEEKTEIFIETILKGLGYTDIHIEFKKGKLIDEVPLYDN